VAEFTTAEFREYVDDLDITDDQKDELLRALWSVAVAFVDLDWGVESIQHAMASVELAPEEG
jgi:hypothetical protein